MTFRPLILAFTAIVLGAVATIQVTDLRRLRQRAYAEAERRASSQVQALAQYVRGAFVAADSSLRQIAIHSRRIGGPSAASTEWLPILQAARAALAEQGSLSVTDDQGIIRHTTLPEILGGSRRKNYIYEYLSRQPSDELVMDVPFTGPVSPHRWIVPVGRRLEGAGGQFEGIVVQVITPENFRPFFESIRIGDRGVIKLFHPSGTLIIQQPALSSAQDPNAPPDPLFTRIGPEASGITRGALTATSGPFLSAFQRVDGPDFVVTVSLSEDEFLADWRLRLRRSVLEFLGVAGVMSVMALVALRQMQARSGVERALANVQRTEAARLREANERLEAALQRETQARQEIEVASRLKDEFLMTLSHELRTPLNAILGWLHVLKSNAVEDQQRTAAFNTIERNARAQARLIEDLLDVSGAISGKLQILPRPADLREIALAAAATLQPAIAARAIDFITHIDGGLPAVAADPDRLQQAVWNLVSNAIKFSVHGGVVELGVRRIEAGVELRVRDYGTGITPAFLPFVFERFRQADAGPRREHGGLGLGLAIARHIVELHGGTITAHSEGEGHGSTFTIVLPVP